jgi:HSP20 family molecular chaperone IbpA
MSYNGTDIFDGLSIAYKEMKRFLGDSANKPDKGVGQERDGREPLVDIADYRDRIVVIAELKGAIKKSVCLRVIRNVLEISAELRRECIEDYLQQRGNLIQRRIRLPVAVDSKAMSYKLNNGVLEINIPKMRTGIKEKANSLFH